MSRIKNDNNVLLIFPPGWEPVPPIGLAYLKSYLEQNGFNTKILDLNVLFTEKLFVNRENKKEKKTILNNSYEVLKKKISKFKPTVVGFTLLEPTFSNSIHLIKKIRKDYDNNLKIVVGGPHVSYLKKRVLDFKEIDVAIPGEGELPLLELMQKIEEKKPLHSSSYYTRIGNKIVGGTNRKFIRDLDSVPFPDYSDLRFNKYQFPFITSITSRGCVKRCTFCGVRYIYSNYRKRSVENILDEIKRNVNEYGFKILAFTDSLFNAIPELSKKISNKISEEKLDINWMAEVHPKIPKNLAKIWYKSGCRFIYTAPETGSPKVADIINKGINIDEAEKGIINAHESGINISSWYITGFPFETKVDLLKTFRFMEKTKSFSEEILVSPFGLSINTSIYRNPDKYGVKNIQERGYNLYCTYDTINPKMGFINQMKMVLNLYKEYNPQAYNSKMMRNVRDILGDKKATKEKKFLLTEDFQFPYKLYGVDYDEDYSYIELFEKCFKEILKN